MPGCRTNFRLSCLAILVLIQLAGMPGCQSKSNTQSAPPNAAPPAPQNEAASTTTGETAKEVSLEVVDGEGFQKVIQSLRGKVILVDAWATWCPPCKAAFPHTVALHDKYAGQGLAVVSVAMDTEDAHQEALQFLSNQKAAFTNLRSKLGAEELAFEQFKFDPVLPHLQLFDRDGKLVRKFVTGDPDAVFTPEDVDLAIRKLVTASPQR